MENILNHFNEKVISLTENYLKNFIFSKGISSFTEDLVAEFATFGSNLTQYMIELVEEEIFKINKIDKQFNSLEKDERNIVSIFGNISFKRRYYYDKQKEERVYLLDNYMLSSIQYSNDNVNWDSYDVNEKSATLDINKDYNFVRIVDKAGNISDVKQVK